MKRLHVHVGVKDIDESIRFYNALFGAEPVKTKPDYAKWMLDDPRINFAVSTRTRAPGVDHLGLQVDAADELEALRVQMRAAEVATYDDGKTLCCYARSDKSWVKDPVGVAWETYHTMEDAEVMQEAAGACCAPQEQASTCC